MCENSASPNVSIGLVGIISLWKPVWRIPAAVAGGLFLILARVEHLLKRGRTAEENLAMYSDLAIGVLMGVYVVWRI